MVIFLKFFRVFCNMIWGGWKRLEVWIVNMCIFVILRLFVSLRKCWKVIWFFVNRLLVNIVLGNFSFFIGFLIIKVFIWSLWIVFCVLELMSYLCLLLVLWEFIIMKLKRILFVRCFSFVKNMFLLKCVLYFILWWWVFFCNFCICFRVVEVVVCWRGLNCLFYFLFVD